MQTIKELLQLILDNNYKARIQADDNPNGLEISFTKQVGNVTVGDKVFIKKEFVMLNENVGKVITELSQRLLGREQKELKINYGNTTQNTIS